MKKLTTLFALAINLTGCATPDTPHYNHYEVRIERPSGNSDIKNIRLFHSGIIAAHSYEKDFKVELEHSARELHMTLDLPKLDQSCAIRERVSIVTDETQLSCVTSDGHKLNVVVATYENRKNKNLLHSNDNVLIMLLNK